MKVLVAEPMKSCRVQKVDGLADMQELVGGRIEAVYPFLEPVAVLVNADGKNLGLRPNRLLCDGQGVPYDMICGTLLVVGLGAEDFISLTEEQIDRYKKQMDQQRVIAVPFAGQPENSSKKKRSDKTIER